MYKGAGRFGQRRAVKTGKDNDPSKPRLDRLDEVVAGRPLGAWVRIVGWPPPSDRPAGVLSEAWDAITAYLDFVLDQKREARSAGHRRKAEREELARLNEGAPSRPAVAGAKGRRSED